MRVTTLLRSLLGLEETRVLDVNFDELGLVIDVAPTWRRGRCSECGQVCPGYDRDRGRRWRHLDLGVVPVLHSPSRIRCALTLNARSGPRRRMCKSGSAPIRINEDEPERPLRKS